MRASPRREDARAMKPSTFASRAATVAMIAVTAAAPAVASASRHHRKVRHHGAHHHPHAALSMRFITDPWVPPGAVPHEIAHVTGLNPHTAYALEFTNRGASDNCLAAGTTAAVIVDAGGVLNVLLPGTYYGDAASDLCPGATYD